MLDQQEVHQTSSLWVVAARAAFLVLGLEDSVVVQAWDHVVRGKDSTTRAVKRAKARVRAKERVMRRAAARVSLEHSVVLDNSANVLNALVEQAKIARAMARANLVVLVVSVVQVDLEALVKASPLDDQVLAVEAPVVDHHSRCHGSNNNSRKFKLLRLSRFLNHNFNSILA